MKNCKPMFRGVLCNRAPGAAARMAGTPAAPGVQGWVRFWPVRGGVLAEVSLSGLPGEERSIHGLHIHAGESCTGTSKEPLKNTGGHYDTGGRAHPFHSGDMPPVFAWRGQAWAAVFLGGLTLRELLGHTVVLHALPDDLKSQPAGASGEKIACGVICPAEKGDIRG